MVRLPEEMDIDEYYAQIQAEGVVISEPIADQYWGDRTFMVKDPEGYMLNLFKVYKKMSTDELVAVGREQS